MSHFINISEYIPDPSRCQNIVANDGIPDRNLFRQSFRQTRQSSITSQITFPIKSYRAQSSEEVFPFELTRLVCRDLFLTCMILSTLICVHRVVFLVHFSLFLCLVLNLYFYFCVYVFCHASYLCIMT